MPDICQDEWHILGDSAYPIKKYLITPYRDYGNLTEQQIRFNYKLSACRVKIENAFGLLKGRFRQLMRLDFTTVQRCCKFIIACCTLHNLCLLDDDYFDDFLEEGSAEQFEHNEENFNFIEYDRHYRHDKIEGEEKRNLLCHILQ